MKCRILTVIAICCVAPRILGADERPNILFLFADDHAFNAVRAGGNDEVQTPNIDRLYRQGTVFTHTYNQAGWNGAVCLASRAMLNTGLFLWRAQAADGKLKSEWVPARKMWAQRMTDAGYQTFFSGKWHISANAEDVFEVVRHVRGGMPNQTDTGYDRPKSRDDDSWKPWDPSFEGFWKGGRHWSEVLGDDGVEFMSMAASDKRPFFMYLAFNAPHDPRQSPKEYVDRYPPDNIRVPNSFLKEYPFDIGSNHIRDEKLAPFPRTEYSVQVNRQEYYAIITHMDAQIGRILDALEATGQAERTWIFFTADHGLSCGHHGLLGKQNMYDHSMRVPFAVTGPEVMPGRRIHQPVYLQSVMATSLELAGADSSEVEFTSLLPLLKSRSENTDAFGNVYGAYTETQRMVVVGNEKLILYPKINVSRLFDLKSDPEEIRDLSGRTGALSTKRRLFREFLKLQQQLGDSLDVKSAFPELSE
ncbi:MAG: sulfatase-like hydrolase/transferase [Planctomycetaceae bacterium]|nr:sulfatase-like hydrolase/transferase [Planctomycetaceae bacterium]